VGSVLLAWASKPVWNLASQLGLVYSKLDLQIISAFFIQTTFNIFTEINPSPSRPRKRQCPFPIPPPSWRLPSVWQTYRSPLRSPLMFSIPRPFLDGEDTPEHVRLLPRYVHSTPLPWYDKRVPIPILTVNVATYLLLDRAPNALRPSQTSINFAIALLTFTAVVFRAEVVILLGPIVLQALYERYIPLKSVVKIGLVAGLVSLGMWFFDYNCFGNKLMDG
jgi:hypothetical protein